MGDKVYPMQERPSAPPVGLSDGHGAVALQMPEMAIRKEQEQTLIKNQEKERDDQALYYSAWPPATAATSGLGAPAPGQGRRPRRRSCFCCCIASFLATVATILIIVGIAALVVYLVVRPKAPDFSIKEATINEFNLTSEGSLYNVNTDMVFSVEAKNPNKKINLYYDDVHVQLFYADQQIGVGSIPAFQQGHRNTTLLTLPIQGHDLSLPSSTGSSLQSSFQNAVSIPLHTMAVTKARVKIGSWKSRHYKIHVDCSLQLSNPRTSPGGHVSLLSKSCKIKIKFLFFYRTVSS